MMLHRHFEEDKARREAGMTRLSDVTPSPSTSTDPTDPTYVPVDGAGMEAPKKAGRPKKSN